MMRSGYLVGPGGLTQLCADAVEQAAPGFPGCTRDFATYTGDELFCGAEGSSRGGRWAPGVRVMDAPNHWELALRKTVRSSEILWASPTLDQSWRWATAARPEWSR